MISTFFCNSFQLPNHLLSLLFLSIRYTTPKYYDMILYDTPFSVKIFSKYFSLCENFFYYVSFIETQQTFPIIISVIIPK